MGAHLLPPIFFWEPNDLVAFDSVGIAERYLEPQDVLAGGCGLGFDSEGRGIVASVQKGGARHSLGFDDRVRVTRDPSRSVGPGEMREIFREYLTACGKQLQGRESLEELMSLAVSLARTH